MPITKNKISYKLDLSNELEGLNKTQAAEMKRKVSDYVLSTIRDSVLDTISPVTGDAFKPLSKEYKDFKKKKGKGKDANLVLFDNMINSINAVSKSDGVSFQVTNKTEKLKSFNHNVGDTLPRRPFLPDDTKRGKYGTFNEEIRNGIKEITKEFRAEEGLRREPRPERREPVRRVEPDVIQPQISTELSLEDLLNEQSIFDLIERELE